MPRPRLDGRTPLFIVINAASGEAERAQREMTDVLRAARRQHHFFTVAGERERDAEFRRAAVVAARHEGALIVAGDDAAINAGVNATLPTGRPLGIVPLGPVLHTCRMPDAQIEPAHAIAELLTARVCAQRVGWVNGRCFLASASVGLHPEILAARELHPRRSAIGRARELWSALTGMWRSPQRLELELRCGDQREIVRTPTLLVDNDSLQLRRIGLDESDDLQRQRLAALVVRPLPTPKLCWLALRGAQGELARDQNLRAFGFRRLTVRPRFHGWGAIKVLVDGQVRWMRPPLVFSVSQYPLMLMTPVRAPAMAAA